MNPSSLVDVIVCGLLLDSKIFISCRLGFCIGFAWPEGYPRLFLVLCSPDNLQTFIFSDVLCKFVSIL